ncbi:MAG: hypothetical protein GY754_31135 [bacterium]|nr:hypothetical protein [bacterium]
MKDKPRVIKRIKDDALEYVIYLFKEFIDYLNYVNAFFIGIIINYLSDGTLFGKISPFLIPVLVQSFSKSVIRFKFRHMKRLLQLPSERSDPVFIMDENGEVILSPGITRRKFKIFDVKNIIDFIGQEGFNKIDDYIKKISENKNPVPGEAVEVYSDINNHWYEVTVKPIKKASDDKKEFLVWFTNITAKKGYEKKLADLNRFSGEIYSLVNTNIKRNDIYFLFARFMLKQDYKGVFFTQMDNNNNLQGYIFKDVGVIKRSKLVTIPVESPAPVTSSRKKLKIVTDSIESFDSREEFERIYPFDEKVKKFLNFDINNFINYHHGEISIIIFNKKDRITGYDGIFMQIMVNNARTALDLLKNISKK